MEENKDKPERRPSKKDVRSSPKPKAATLPAGAVLLATPGEGFFTKIRRCLRIRSSKGKYDFSHPEPETVDAAANSVARSHSTDSPAGDNVENGRIEKPRVKSSPLKLSRRSKQDKEEVVLVRKDKRSSFGFRLGVKSAGDITKDSRQDVFVVHVGEDKDVKEDGVAKSEKSAAQAHGSSRKESDDVFEDFDPDYETLDNVRQKMQSQASPRQEANVAMPKQTKTTTGQPLQVKTKTNSDGRDSGLDSPFTDSPGSGRDSQAQSVTSSMFSSSAVFSETSDPLRDSALSTASMVLVNGEPADPESSVQSGNAQSNCSTSVLQEDDLYANSKVLFRKKSQRQSHSQDGSSSPVDSRLSDGREQLPSSARNSLSPADIAAAADENNAESLAPPPLPARNYSEEDIASLSIGAESNSEQKVPKDDILTPTTHTENCYSGAGARPKTTRNSSFADSKSDPPPLPMQNVSIDANPYADVDDIDLPTSTSANDAQTSEDMYFASCGNIYEDIPARADAKQGAPETPQTEVECRIEDELMFIDEDPSSLSLTSTPESTPERKPVPPKADYDTESVELPDDVMIVSASDSVCGNETTDESQASSEKTAVAVSVKSEELATVQELANSVTDERSSEEEEKTKTADDKTKKSAEDGKVSAQVESNAPDVNKSGGESDAGCAKKTLELTGASSSITATAEPCAASAAEAVPDADQAACDNAMATASSSSSSHQLSASSPASSSSADTLDDMDNFDPDDLEGKDHNPPSGPPIHMTQRQVWKRADMRWLTVPPPIPPHRRVSGRSSNRNVKSMDLSRHLDGDDQAAGASSARRHSSIAASAKLHQDFLESMKQLKDCGWYWGPLSYEEAESKLCDKRDGSFLVRDSSNENYILSLSFKSLGQVHHTRIEHHKGLFSFWSQPDSHGKAQICQFIEQTVENSRNGRFLYFLRPPGPGSPPMPIQLLYPVSRFCRVPSLQHMCRFLVLRLVRRDHIDHLPLPQKVKSYLLEKQYYVETLEED